MISKTVKKTLLSTMLISGCSASAIPESQPAFGSLSPQEILERADREDLRLSSYHMTGSDIYTSGSEKEETQFDLTVQFDDSHQMYIISRHADYLQLMRYTLSDNGHHSAETDQLSAGVGCFVNTSVDGTVQESYYVQDQIIVEDYISIPSIYLYKSNEYRSVELNENFIEIEVVFSGNEQNMPEGMESVIRYRINSDYHLVQSGMKETGPENSYVFEKKRDFEGFNENLLNLDKMDALFEKVQAGQLSEGDKLQISDYLAS